MRLEIATGNTNFSVSRSYSRIHIGSVDPSSRISRDLVGLVHPMQVTNFKTSFHGTRLSFNN